MPETATIVYATEELMPSMFGSMRLRVDRDSIDLSRLSSPAGLAFLAGHDGDAPLGQVNRAEIHDGVAYASVRLESTTRSEPFLEELRQGIRDGISPGFLILAAEFVEEDNDVVMLITRWQPFEISSTPIPRMMSASLLRIAGSPSTNKQASYGGARSGVDLSAGASRSKAHTVSHTPPDARTDALRVSHDKGRARVTEPILTKVERAKKMSEIETRVDAKLADLSRREMALADVKAKPATGDPLALDKTILVLAGLASNPSAPTPPMPGVEVSAANRGHVSARVPTMSLALTGATTYGTEIQSPTERGDIQPQGRRAERLLRLLRPVSVTYGSKGLPTLDSPPASGMIVDGGAPLALTDATFQNPAPTADFHMGQVRSSYSLQAVNQGGQTFEALVDDSLRAEMANLQVAQIVTGSGVAPSVRGILNTPNIGTSVYLATNRGTASSFRSAEDELESVQYGPEIRRVWLVASSLYRTARMTLREPGNQEFVVSNGRVLGEYPVIKNGDLSNNQALLADLEYLAFCQWDMVDVTFDMITNPGIAIVTVSSWFDLVVIRPNAVVLMDQV